MNKGTILLFINTGEYSSNINNMIIHVERITIKILNIKIFSAIK